MELSNLEKQIESKEGHDIQVTVYLMRHPHKDSYEGSLSSKGIEDAKKLKKAFDRFKKLYKTDTLEVAHSGHERSHKTAEILSATENAQENSEFEGEIREGLAFIGSDEFEEKYAKLTKDNNGDESAGVQMIIDTGDKRHDPESLSSIEMSQKIAQELFKIVEQTKNYKSGTKKPIALISHSGVIENFLVDLLKERNKENSLEAIGGPLDFLEDLRLYINRKNQDEVEIKFKFRNREGSLSEEELKQLAGFTD